MLYTCREGIKMNFQDKKIAKISQNKTDSVFKMIVELLCGENYHKKLLNQEERDLLTKLLGKAQTVGLNYAQFNELLLLLDQDRVSRAFFEFFFGNGNTKPEETRITLNELKQGIIKFRGFAMLAFGNFRFAYKRLISKDETNLKEDLKPYCKSPYDIINEFKKRPDKVLDIEKINKNQTWYTGYISGTKYENEARQVEQLSNEKSLDDELKSFGDRLEKMGKEIKEVERKALKNTDVYLTWDYMDVYIATSMRHKWEFEETFDFITEVFKRGSKIGKLKLRYFDPTQSLCVNRIDKGLVEALMLKKSLCTIYMAQESDTMGKDSELAATLAQGKTVIAYVPKINVKNYAEKIKKYPLDYFKTRLFILQAEGMLDDEHCKTKLKKHNKNFKQTIKTFIDKLEKYRASNLFTLWEEKEEDFKKNNSDLFDEMCRIIAIAEHYSCEKRAKNLKKHHPLAIQVNLESGVANGVLVVRTPKDCAKLLYNVLTNSMNFRIRHIKRKMEGVTVLEEEISGCPFRVVTDYEKLTNSFWNFYLLYEK